MELVCKLSMAEWKGVDMLEECIEDQYHESTLSEGDGHARGGCEMGGGWDYYRPGSESCILLEP